MKKVVSVLIAVLMFCSYTGAMSPPRPSIEAHSTDELLYWIQKKESFYGEFLKTIKEKGEILIVPEERNLRVINVWDGYNEIDYIYDIDGTEVGIEMKPIGWDVRGYADGNPNVYFNKRYSIKYTEPAVNLQFGNGQKILCAIDEHKSGTLRYIRFVKDSFEVCISYRPSVFLDFGFLKNFSFKIRKIDENKHTEFDDVKENDWFYESVSHISIFRYIDGKEEGVFSPYTPFLREDAARAMWRFAGKEDYNPGIKFEDIPEDESYSYIGWAQGYEIINGIDEKHFAPKSAITRQDFAIMVSRTIDLYFWTPKPHRDGSHFSDEAEISDYAKDAVEYLYGIGVINGKSDGSFDPKGIITRAEAAQVIYNLCVAMRRI